MQDEDLILDSSLSFHDIKIGRGIVRIHPDRVEFINSRLMKLFPLYEKETAAILAIFFGLITYLVFTEMNPIGGFLVGAYTFYQLTRLYNYRNVTYVNSIPRNRIWLITYASLRNRSIFIHYENEEGKHRFRHIKIPFGFSSSDNMKRILGTFREEGFEVKLASDVR